MKYKIAIKNNKYEVEIGEINDGIARVNVNGRSYEVTIENFAEVAQGAALAPAPRPPAAPAAPQAPAPSPKPAPAPSFAAPPKPATPSPKPSTAAEESGAVLAPIPGLIVDIKVKKGDPVIAGQTVATMEAMKMENNIVCNIDGVVKEIRVQKGSQCATGEVIMIVA